LTGDFIDGEIAPLYSDKGRPGIPTRFAIGLLLLKHIYGLSDEGGCERWVYDPYFQFFTGEEFFQHEFPHERSDLSHWRKRLGEKLELLAESLRVAHKSGALRSKDLSLDDALIPGRRANALTGHRNVAVRMRRVGLMALASFGAERKDDAAKRRHQAGADHLVLVMLWRG
jgi:IS5 family transposase